MARTISYAGKKFSDRSTIQIQTQAVYDEMDVNVILKRMIITVNDYVTPTNSPDCDSIEAAMDALHNKLMKSGMPLYIQEIGFGNKIENVNEPGGSFVQDLRGGPKPRSFSWQPVAATRCAYITWTCEVVVSPCETIPGFQKGIVAMNWHSSYAINERGYSTRTISGYYQIAVTQEAGSPPELEQNADKYRESVLTWFGVPDQFERSQNYQIAADGHRMDFTIQDKEIESPNAWPEDVVHISAPIRSRFRYPRERESQSITSLSVDLELIATAPRIRAYEIFDAIIRHRTELFAAEGANRIVDMFEISEDLYTNKFSFILTVRSVWPLNHQLRLYRYFELVPNSWADWKHSVHDAETARGLANLSVLDYTDPDHKKEMVTLCEVESISAEPYSNHSPPSRILFQQCNDAPPAENSWVNGTVDLIEAPQLEATHHTTYGTTTVLQTETGPDDTVAIAEPLINVDEPSVDHHFSESSPSQRWIWRGTIQRVGYPIPPPGKLTVGGKDAKIVGTPYFNTKLIGYSFCLPIYEATWNIGLVLMESPAEIGDDEYDRYRQYPPEDAV